MISRRRFLTSCAGVLAVPITALAQEAPKMWRIGGLFVGPRTNVVSGGARVPEGYLRSPFGPVVDGLKELGWIEGHNIVFELRSGGPEGLTDLAVDLVRMPVDIIVVPNAGLAAIVRRTTTTIPVVVMSAGELEGTGLIASLAKPGGNITGTQLFSRELIGKRLELLRQALPLTIARVGVLSEDATMPEIVQLAKKYQEETDRSSRALGLEPAYLTVRRAEEFESVFADSVVRRAQALIVYSTPFMFVNRARVAALVLQRRLPTIFEMRAYVEAGGHHVVWR